MIGTARPCGLETSSDLSSARCPHGGTFLVDSAGFDEMRILLLPHPTCRNCPQHQLRRGSGTPNLGAKNATENGVYIRGRVYPHCPDSHRHDDKNSINSVAEAKLQPSAMPPSDILHTTYKPLASDIERLLQVMGGDPVVL